MESNIYLRVALPTPLRRYFDYLPPPGTLVSNLKPGVRIKVPFQSRELIGILLQTSSDTSIPPDKMKQALAILDDEPLLPPDLFDLCHFAAQYYHHALGEVLQAAYPTLLRQKKESAYRELLQDVTVSEPSLALNLEQHQAVQAIQAAINQFQVFLLEGVTGSGKTEVYLQVMQYIIQQNKQVLMLIPEISLTPQTISRFRERFNVPIVALHSNLTQKERLAGWWAAKENRAQIVIGTRSALFTPFANLGLIIIDEEHDNSFKQQDRFRYHARDLAIRRAQGLRIPIVLGSATPSLETLWNAQQKKYQHLSLTQRAGTALLPKFNIVDLRLQKSKTCIAPELKDAMRYELQQGNQVMLFLNRRGFAPVLYCLQCAWMALCSRCDARLVYHAKQQNLRCHHCDAKKAIPDECPQCHTAGLLPLGMGTQRVEAWLEKEFPQIPILRFDRDSMQKKGRLEQCLDEIQTGGPMILLGTQMLAKGHHFPALTLVGILDADAGFFSADFRAALQMGQLIVQVAGRAGRGDQGGSVWVQTHQPDNHLLQTLIHEGYPAFAHLLLAQRKNSLLPPFSYFALIRAESYQANKCQQFLENIKQFATEEVSVFGPVAALMPKRKGLYCFQLLMRATKRKSLQSYLDKTIGYLQNSRQLSGVKWSVDVDPVEV